MKLVTKAWGYRLSEQKILIHTSVKLVTGEKRLYERLRDILIHTSVKLVTMYMCWYLHGILILIHTSVKLVTPINFLSVLIHAF